MKKHISRTNIDFELADENEKLLSDISAKQQPAEELSVAKQISQAKKRYGKWLQDWGKSNATITVGDALELLVTAEAEARGETNLSLCMISRYYFGGADEAISNLKDESADARIVRVSGKFTVEQPKPSSDESFSPFRKARLRALRWNPSEFDLDPKEGDGTQRVNLKKWLSKAREEGLRIPKALDFLLPQPLSPDATFIHGLLVEGPMNEENIHANLAESRDCEIEDLDRSRVTRAIRELKKRHMILNRRPWGYYRTDRPLP